jgi:ribosomal peptide maturation radical SAM protein 1
MSAARPETRPQEDPHDHRPVARDAGWGRHGGCPHTSRLQANWLGTNRMPRVLLVSMPYGALDRPALGLSLLQPELREAGIACETRYLTFRFAEVAGFDDYAWVAHGLPYSAFAGDWTFAQALYGPRPEDDAAYVDDVLRSRWGRSDEDVSRLMRVREHCEPFLDDALAGLPWDGYDVVGFTSTFEQNIASLALAKRLKAAHPHLVIVFGGANWEGEMGQELHRRFGFVDLACSGEADRSFPAALAAMAAGTPLAEVPGLVCRDAAGNSHATGPGVLVRDLDALPFVDFDPYFRDLEASGVAARVDPSVLIETGRGCWWGAKSHCTFCGLNGRGLAFRSKTPERALAEIRHLRRRYRTDRLDAVDNILDMDYFRTLFPRIVQEEPGLSLFYEVKANLSADQVALLAAAGVRTIQPGLESMSDHVLKLMRKGTTALQNVQLLKWCREHDIKVEWNVLYGFPGEDADDYDRMYDLFDAIWFLDPPGGYGAVRLDRFSPYHEDPERHGIVNVRPMTPYASLYPFGTDAQMRIAYYFDYDYADGRHPPSYAQAVVDRVVEWMGDQDRGNLRRLGHGAGELTLVDERPGREKEVRLAGWQALAYDACDRVRARAGLGRLPTLSRVPPDELTEFLDGCVEAGVMLRDDDRYLALGVQSPARRWVPPTAATGRQRVIRKPAKRGPGTRPPAEIGAAAIR